MKRLFFIVYILIILVTIGLIPLNLFICEFPEWIIWIFIVILFMVNIIYNNKFRTNVFTKIFFAFLSITIAIFVWIGSYCNPYWNSYNFRSYDKLSSNYDVKLTYDKAQADLEQMMYYLKKCHPIFLKDIPQKVQDAYNLATEYLQNANDITIASLNRELQTILSPLSDANTEVFANYEDYYLRTIDRREAGNWTLTQVNGKDLTQIFEENKSLYSYETESWAKKKLRSDLESLSGLSFLEINPSGVKYTWRNLIGTEEIETYTTSDYLSLEDYKTYNEKYMTEENEEEDFISYVLNADSNLAILQLKSCNYNDIYIKCLNQMFTELKDKNIENVAVDLRGNGGGSSLVVNEFIRYLDVDTYIIPTEEWRLGVVMFSPLDSLGVEINKKYDSLIFKGNVYLLTDNSSFSSAMMFAQYIKDNKLGTIIGEAPGNTPNGYGEIAIFRLENSGLYFQVSTKIFHRADQNISDELVTPDVECKSDEVIDVLKEIIQEQN